MERENRKRGREGDEKQDAAKSAKKVDLSYIDDEYLDYDNKENNMSYYDDPCVSGNGGVFDFPWLKDGMMIFKTEDCSELESTIASYSINPDDETYNTILYQSPLNFHEDHDKFDVDLSSVFQVDELDNVDCIWSSVIDEPLLTGFNKI
ncbi:uncharacterized protein LOC132312683 [Cornus florida]|uniref:uncharacterized protein LOC132312683 n=1 Tax=Cornus florida TaxID=4283 RepID=UPI00289C232D|nr:uncharacterized protein LOC132312683 [Cornus florida]XP_059667139.1 uncharacterized protein LOC132312683 [Cornus florida]